MDLWVVKMRAVGPESEIFRAIRSEAPGSGRFGLSVTPRARGPARQAAPTTATTITVTAAGRDQAPWPHGARLETRAGVMSFGTAVTLGDTA